MERSLISSRLVVPMFVLVLVSLSAQVFAQNAINGGLMYDKWWVMNGADEPTGDHPLYPPAGQQSGSGTFRCKECHGWDYKGAAGAYGSGSHFTGIPGVFGSTMTASEMFDIIKNPDGDGTGGTTPNGHAYGAIGLADEDIGDLVEFLQTLLIDTDTIIDANGAFTGDSMQGEGLFFGVALCGICHGADGMKINLGGTPEQPAGLGTHANANPWEFQHKIRLGQPNSLPQMPSWVEGGGSLQGVADIGAFVQENLPTGIEDTPTVPTASEWSMIIFGVMMFITGMLVLQGRRSVAAL